MESGVPMIFLQFHLVVSSIDAALDVKPFVDQKAGHLS